MKKQMAIVLSILMVLTVLAGCTAPSPSTLPEAQSDAASTAGAEEPSQQAEIYIYQAKYEIDEALKAACAEYTELNPNVTFVVESTSSGDYLTQLKAMFSGGKAPDIFWTTGNTNVELMAEYMEDLSNEAWIPYMVEGAKASGTYNGKTYGFPVATEGYGYLYHKDIFEDAGITKLPTTRTELKEVCEQLVAKGYTPFSSNYSEWYQSGMFKFGMTVSRQNDPIAFIEALNSGAEKLVGNSDFSDLAAWIEIDTKYALSPLNTDFNTQVSDFATKKTAMMLGGSWTQPALDAVDENMNVGMYPIPMGEDPAVNDMLCAGCAGFFHINNASSNVDACKAFLEWLAMTPEGQKNLASGFKVTPAFTNIAADEDAIGPTGLALKEYMDAGKTYGMYDSLFPSGMGGVQLFGETVNKYAAGKMTSEEFVEELQKDWESLN